MQEEMLGVIREYEEVKEDVIREDEEKKKVIWMPGKIEDKQESQVSVNGDMREEKRTGKKRFRRCGNGKRRKIRGRE